MHDQASTLRIMASTAPSIHSSSNSTRTAKPMRSIAITGGKGGVGKSNLSVNLALELGFLGSRVALLDADFGLANADLLCGITPKFHLGHAVAGLKELDEITISLAENVKLIPGGSGVEELANFSVLSRPHIFEQLELMELEHDFMLIDTAAGIAENVSGVLSSATEIIVVVTPEPTSIIDAYATIKVILRRSPGKSISIVVNNVVGIGDAEQVFQSISHATRGFLGHETNFLGMIPNDSKVPEAVREQVPVTQFAPDSPASRAIRLIAKNLYNRKNLDSQFSNVQTFWDSLANN
jgi:flagellar biosynthesis protein FlhG